MRIYKVCQIGELNFKIMFRKNIPWYDLPWALPSEKKWKYVCVRYRSMEELADATTFETLALAREQIVKLKEQDRLEILKHLKDQQFPRYYKDVE